MLRIVLFIFLLASLIFMIRQFNSEPLPEVQGSQGRTRSRPVPLSGSEAGLGQKPAVRAVPEVGDGYLFNEERQLDVADLGEFGESAQETSEETAGGLEQVFYSGSLIVGDRRQGLITYQENNRGGGQLNRVNRYPGRVLPGAAEAQSGSQHQVLKPGDRFMGYLVVAVEPEKIVFEKGGVKLEKFLYDQNKKRPVVSESLRAMPTASQAGAATGVSSAVVTPPTNLPPGVRVAPTGQPPQTSTPFRRSIRSRRLPRVNPSTGAASRPVPPARPVSPNN